jgi:hypothetical protein
MNESSSDPSVKLTVPGPARLKEPLKTAVSKSVSSFPQVRTLVRPRSAAPCPAGGKSLCVDPRWIQRHAAGVGRRGREAELSVELFGLPVGDQVDVPARGDVNAEERHDLAHDQLAEAAALVGRFHRDDDHLKEAAAVADYPTHAD